MLRSMPFLFAILCLGPVAALAAGDAVAGRDLAVTWCSSCHVVNGGEAASDATRPLATIARDEGVTDERLRGFLTQPHGKMPKLSLSRLEIENLIAYMRSLR